MRKCVYIIVFTTLFCGIIAHLRITESAGCTRTPHITEYNNTGKLRTQVPFENTVDQNAFYFNSGHPSSNAEFDVYLHAVLQKVNSSSEHSLFAVNLGANDGKTIDPLYALYAAGARGLLVELDPGLFNELQANVPWDRCIKVQSTISPMNINQILLDANVPREMDIFKIDIDSYDVFVTDSMLLAKTFRPKIIIMEINEKIPPPLSFHVNYYTGPRWHGDHFYGASIQAIVSMLNQHDYIPVALDWNNLILVDSVFAQQFSVLNQSVESLYSTGYWHRPGRTAAFPWNSNVDHWAATVRENPLGVAREIFDFMINSASFKESSQTFSLSFAPADLLSGGTYLK